MSVNLTFLENFFLRPESLTEKKAGKTALKILSGIANFVTIGLARSRFNKKVVSEIPLREVITNLKAKRAGQDVLGQTAYESTASIKVKTPLINLPDLARSIAVDFFSTLNNTPLKEEVGHKLKAQSDVLNCLKTNNPMQSLIEQLTQDQDTGFSEAEKEAIVEQAYLVLKEHGVEAND